MPEDQILDYIESIDLAEERHIRILVHEILDSFVGEQQENSPENSSP